jgi:hypothetical protein
MRTRYFANQGSASFVAFLPLKALAQAVCQKEAL